MDESIELIGGSLWVNLLNTKRMEDGELIDVLDDVNKMTGWLSFHKVELSSDLNKQGEDLKLLRGLLSELLKASNSSEEVLSQLNKFLHNTSIYLGLDVKGGKFIRCFKAVNPNNTGLIRIIEDFFNTIEVIDFNRVRQCAHEDCVLYFIDSSKGGRRRWCSMETCGNKHKASVHYKKLKAENVLQG